MTPLDRFLAGHLASHSSPTREQREVLFAKDDDKNPSAGGGLEAEQTGPEGQGEKKKPDAIAAAMLQTHAGIEGNVLETVPGMEQVLEDSTEMFAIALEHPSLENAALQTAYRKRASLKNTSIPSRAGRVESPNRWTDREREGVMNALTTDPEDAQMVLRAVLDNQPERARELSEAIDIRMAQRDESFRLLQKRMSLLMDKTGFGSFLKNIGMGPKAIDKLTPQKFAAHFTLYFVNATSVESVERELQTIIPEEQEREQLLRFLRESADDSYRLASHGLRAKKSLQTETVESLEQWQNKYWEKLREHSAALKRYVLAQVRNRLTSRPNPSTPSWLERLSALEDEVEVAKQAAEGSAIGSPEKAAYEVKRAAIEELYDAVHQPFLEIFNEEITAEDINVPDEALKGPVKVRTEQERAEADKALIFKPDEKKPGTFTTEGNPAFSNKAKLWIDQIPRATAAIEKAERSIRTGEVSPEDTANAEQCAAWETRTQKRAEALLLKSGWNGTTTKRLRLSTNPEHLRSRMYEAVWLRQRTDAWLKLLEMGGPALANRIEDAERELMEIAAQEVDISTYCAEARQRLKAVKPRLEKIGNNDELQSLKVGPQIDARIANVEAPIRETQVWNPELRKSVTVTALEGMKDSEQRRRIRAEMELELRNLERCADEVEKIPSRITEVTIRAQYDFICGNVATSIACYKPSEKKIYINMAKLEEDFPDPAKRAAKKEHIVEHESGHALTHALQETLFPNLLYDGHPWLFEEKPDEKPEAKTEREEFIEHLLKAGEGWGLSRADFERRRQACESICGDAPSAKRRALRSHLDELEQKYGEWQDGTTKPRTEDDKWLHATVAGRRGEVLNEQFEPDPFANVTPPKLKQLSPVLDATVHMAEPLHSDDDDHAPAENHGNQNETDGKNANKTLGEIAKQILIIEEFGLANPDYKDVLAEWLGDKNGTLILGTHRQLLHVWETGRLLDGTELKPPPEENTVYAQRVDELKAATKELSEKVDDVKRRKADPSNAKSHKSHSLLNGVLFLSISDVIKIFNDIKEDFMSQWNRAQERKTSEAAEALTSMIPDDMPAIFGPFGKYASRLKHYARRRKHGAEQEAVHKWEEALKPMDPHVLIKMLGRSPTKDQLKAIILVLTHKGHMEWDNEDLWEGLHMYSRYRMPPEAKYDDILRDMWLRKICTDIWPEEKEFYDHAKTENENAFESGKKRYTNEADDLSNVTGGLSGQLERMLSMFVINHKHPPEEVSPHRYEEFLHFAIRNGKMSMEEKMYYLARGAAEGLLPLTRLRALAGEKGGILNSFPYIEYFSSQNNTRSELDRLNRRLTSFSMLDGKRQDTFKPNHKTTLWIRLEVARNPRVMERIGKGTSKTGAESIDHEDWPWFLPMTGYSGARNALSIISGSRQKTSPQARMNAYFGYSSVFKIFGRVVQAEKEKLSRVTTSDVRTLAQTIAGYIDYDNILNQNGSDDTKQRPYLTETDFSMKPPSGTTTTRECRARINKLVKKVLDTYGDRIMADPDFIRAAKIGSTAIDDGHITNIGEFAPTDDRLKRNNSAKMVDLISKSTYEFASALEKAVLRDRGAGLKEILLSEAENLADEAGSKDTITKANTLAYFQEMRKHEANGEGNGHGGHA